MSCTGQCCKQIIVGQAFAYGINLCIEVIDGPQQCTQLLDQCLHDHLVEPDNGLILGENSCSSNTLDTFLDEVCPANIVHVEEGFQR